MEHAEHEARPELRHHFAAVDQQRNAASLGMWWFLGTEIMFFGGMFCAYLIYRIKYFPEFAAASRSLNLQIGALNTAVLICSSLTVAQAVRAAQLNRANQTDSERDTHRAGHTQIGDHRERDYRKHRAGDRYAQAIASARRARLAR